MIFSEKCGLLSLYSFILYLCSYLIWTSLLTNLFNPVQGWVLLEYAVIARHKGMVTQSPESDSAKSVPTQIFVVSVVEWHEYFSQHQHTVMQLPSPHISWALPTIDQISKKILLEYVCSQMGWQVVTEGDLSFLCTTTPCPNVNV